MHKNLALVQISKQFPGVKALDSVTFDLKPGEVHALCGENGAGKTTLMNILSGNLQPDHGKILIDGIEVTFRNQQEAQWHGIGTVYQEKSLVDNLSVADNIFAGKQPRNSWGLIDYRQLHLQTKGLLANLGIHDINPKLKLDQLSPGKQQMIEIAKALALEPHLLILDEPTASITEQDAKILFNVIKTLAENGKSIIYISHRLSEIFAIADRATILKDGIAQGTFLIKDLSIPKIIRLMVGRDVKHFDYHDMRSSQQAFTVDRFTGDSFYDISFTMQKGEILGLAGLVGAGRSEFATAVFGAQKNSEGNMRIKGEITQIFHPADAIKHGLGYLPEDRKNQGLFLEMSVRENIVCPVISLAGTKKYSKIDLEEKANQIVAKLDIKTPSLSKKVVHLSGGNQQKIVLAKWLLTDPEILIVDEPTAGIDVGAKSEIYKILNDLTSQGKSIILISSDLPEIMGISDRILVFCNGRINGELERGQFSEEKILHFASGMLKENFA